jgi:hypothetical protein
MIIVYANLRATRVESADRCRAIYGAKKQQAGTCNRASLERVNDSNPIDLAPVLHVFREEHDAAGLPCRADDQCVPEGNLLQPMQVDRCKNIGHVRCDNVELSQQLHLAARDAWIEAELSRDGNEVFLEHLQGNNTTSAATLLCDEFDGTALFGGGSFIIGINQNVGVEEATDAHGSDLDRSASRASDRARRGA